MSVRKLSEDLQNRAKLELNEDPDRVQNDLQHIKEWLMKQPHIHARTDDQWLLSFLRGCKFSLERTKEKLDMFYTMRGMVPEFFSNRDPKNGTVVDIIKQGVFLPLYYINRPNMPRVIIIRSGIYDPKQFDFSKILKANMMLMDISLLEDDIGVINGIRVVQDMTGVTLAHLSSPVVLKKAMMCFQETYPNRIKGLHFINVPSVFETVFNMVKQFMTDKIKSRVNIHGSDLDSLYKIIPQDIFPKEYGGNGESIQTIIDRCLKKLEEYEEWFKEDAQYKTNELKRPGKPKTSDEMFGIEGSFRKLNVD